MIWPDRLVLRAADTAKQAGQSLGHVTVVACTAFNLSRRHLMPLRATPAFNDN